MTTLLYFLVFGVSLIGWGIFSNQARSRYSPDFDLSPNCLLTRKPILFLTGHRSVFYFKSYWNFFPIFLAEHGYEVFHLHLPWSKSQDRNRKALEFLLAQQQIHKSYHLVMDSVSYAELKPLIARYRIESIQSLTVITSRDNHIESSLHPNPHPTAYLEMQNTNAPLLVSLSFNLHKILCKGSSDLTLGSLGFYNRANSAKLLERAVTLAEQDLAQN